MRRAIPGISGVAGLLSILAFAPSDGRIPKRPVEIRFAAEVGGRPFACGESYSGVGVRGSTVTPIEFRFFVSGMRLITRSGEEVPIVLEQDGLWQSGDVVLLDFENGAPPCTNGNEQLRHHLAGTVPAGDYTGIRFDIGVPFERNHADLAAQPSPLSLTRMFWAWNSGYKFMRIDMRVAEAGNWMIHLGSTGCTPNETVQAVPTSCLFPNRPSIRFDAFDPVQDTIVFDLAALLEDTDVETNQEQTAAGCMSSQEDRDCAPLFAALGLPHGGIEPAVQRAFQVRAAANDAGAR